MTSPQCKKEITANLLHRFLQQLGDSHPLATYTSRDAPNFAKIAGTKVVNILTLTTSIEDRSHAGFIVGMGAVGAIAPTVFESVGASTHGF